MLHITEIKVNIYLNAFQV